MSLECRNFHLHLLCINICSQMKHISKCQNMTQNSPCLIDGGEESGPPLRSNMAPSQWICNPAAAAPSAVTCHVSSAAGSQWWQKPTLMEAEPRSKAQINTQNQAANSRDNSRVSERKHFVKLTVCCLIAVLSHLHSLSQQLSWCGDRVGWAALGSLLLLLFLWHRQRF